VEEFDLDAKDFKTMFQHFPIQDPLARAVQENLAAICDSAILNKNIY